jgi:hypothetical protein
MIVWLLCVLGIERQRLRPRASFARFLAQRFPVGSVPRRCGTKSAAAGFDSRCNVAGSARMTLGTILLIILILILIGVLPTWPYSRGWGYGPSGISVVVVIILIVLLFSGRL